MSSKAKITIRTWYTQSRGRRRFIDCVDDHVVLGVYWLGWCENTWHHMLLSVTIRQSFSFNFVVIDLLPSGVCWLHCLGIVHSVGMWIVDAWECLSTDTTQSSIKSASHELVYQNLISFSNLPCLSSVFQHPIDIVNHDFPLSARDWFPSLLRNSRCA